MKHLLNESLWIAFFGISNYCLSLPAEKMAENLSISKNPSNMTKYESNSQIQWIFFLQKQAFTKGKTAKFNEIKYWCNISSTSSLSKMHFLLCWNIAFRFRSKLNFQSTILKWRYCFKRKLHLVSECARFKSCNLLTAWKLNILKMNAFPLPANSIRWLGIVVNSWVYYVGKAIPHGYGNSLCAWIGLNGFSKRFDEQYCHHCVHFGWIYEHIYTSTLASCIVHNNSNMMNSDKRYTIHVYAYERRALKRLNEIGWCWLYERATVYTIQCTNT